MKGVAIWIPPGQFPLNNFRFLLSGAYALPFKLRSGLATVYRGLEVLRLQGLVQSRSSIAEGRSSTNEGESLYSLVQKHQHHFTCLQCSKSMKIDDCPVCKIEAELEQKQSIKVFYHTLEFFGLCTFCQAAKG